MNVRNWRAVAIGSLLAAFALTLVTGSAVLLQRERAQAQSDPQAVVEGLIDSLASLGGSSRLFCHVG